MSPTFSDTMSGGRGARHRFAPEILDAVRVASRPDNWRGPTELARHWFWIAFWCAASVWTFNNWTLWASIPVYLLAAFFIGGRQRAVAGVLHMATHRAFMANHRVGSVLGAVFGGYPVLQSFTAYRASHLGEHHGRLGDPERDPDYRQYKDNGLCGDNLGRPALNRYLRKVVGPRSTGSYILYLLRHRIWSRDEAPFERALRITLLVAVLAWAVVANWWLWLILLWFVPLVTTQVWIGAVAELMEHFPLIENAPRIDLYMSWNRDYGFWTRFLFGETDGEGFHLVHHLFPRTPMWRLREVDAILAKDPVYAALPRLSGVLGGMVQIYRSLPPTPRRRPQTGAVPTTT
ncbi:fatty acid desaturase [Actinoalloteichus sp. GBA129-24]|uniref:Fatty acid desaturase n=2 Tax=Actinoalloteichus TaxID=65496 RepID=A0AAC9LB44_9PSEU|nr:fatty acid desaturase [Actinoalloteichus fjordicus]APU13109.1 fatty acid desaturase [Actinoalloteichus fjordicus]APU19060.1 fatty acid desaturase [Actinoalloteichus sp. GBA129-24]